MDIAAWIIGEISLLFYEPLRKSYEKSPWWRFFFRGFVAALLAVIGYCCYLLARMLL